MKKIATVLAAAGLVLLGACHKQPTTENAAVAMDANLADQAAALDNVVDADANAAAANATNEAGASYNNSVDSVRAEAEAAKNSH
ncbi:hypothetical protein [Sphingomonas sp.]|uniref:hypothetical protein n=1 Tax=Sphingomonas sp. TaxID=28214 RepID=UPI002E32FCB2|nr:hypothetical protein [Sphingomonas sp.]HEX4693519.1 hypothetical protein [Sphingomonas sp.]